MKNIRLAFDRSSRHFDKEGRLHVAVSAISKSNVCPYFGAEIPHAGVFGLDPSRVYQMFRDPAALMAAVPTANNLPLLDRHIGVSARDPQKQHVVGSTGTDAEFVNPYLQNSLVVWDADAIDGIVSGAKRELSCSYSYTPVMEPGTYLGMKYDGVMADIQFNHVALVEDGRAGSDVLVSDAMLTDITGVDMTLKEKLLAKMEASGASKSLLEELEKLFDDEGADDDLDEVLPLEAGKPRGEDAMLVMDSTDAFTKARNLVIAMRMVRPLCGEILAKDAASVFRTALRQLGLDEALKSAPPVTALPALWKICTRHYHQQRAGQRPVHAMDSRQVKSFAERFPAAAAVRKAV